MNEQVFYQCSLIFDSGHVRYFVLPLNALLAEVAIILFLENEYGFQV